MKYRSLFYGLVVSVIVCPSVGAELKPNVLFIAVDDLNDWIGCMKGHPD